MENMDIKRKNDTPLKKKEKYLLTTFICNQSKVDYNFEPLAKSSATIIRTQN